MTSPFDIAKHVVAVIETRPGLFRKAGIMAYDRLGQGGWEVFVVVRPAGSPGIDVFTYGDGYARTWLFQLEVYAHFDRPASCAERLLKAIGEIVTAFEEYEHLKQGTGAYLECVIESITTFDDQVTEEGNITSVRSDIMLRVQEEVHTASKEV